MNPAWHLLRLHPAPRMRDSEEVRLARPHDRGGAAIFRAPALPTPHQFSSELPFTVNFPAEDPRSDLMARKSDLRETRRHNPPSPGSPLPDYKNYQHR